MLSKILVIAIALLICSTSTPSWATSYAAPPPSFLIYADIALSERLYAEAERLYLEEIAKGNMPKKSLYTQIGVRVGLMESLFWQRKYKECQEERKRIVPLVEQLNRTIYGIDDYFVKQKNICLIARFHETEAWLEQLDGNFDAAATILAKTVKLISDSGESPEGQRRRLYCYSHLASILSGQGNDADAIRILNKACLESKSDYEVFETEKSSLLQALASLLFKTGQIELSKVYFDQAGEIDFYSELVTEPYVPEVYLNVYNITYSPGSSWSREETIAGRVFHCIRIKGIEIKVCATVRENMVATTIEIHNTSTKPIQLFGRKPELIVVGRDSSYATLLEPLMASKVGLKPGYYWPQIRTSMTPIGYSNLPLNVYGLGGFPPPVMDWGGTVAGMSNGGEDSNPHPAIDPTIAERAHMQASLFERYGRIYCCRLIGDSLIPQDLFPGQTIKGNLYFFASNAKARGYVLQLPIGYPVFVFPIEQR